MASKFASTMSHSDVGEVDGTGDGPALGKKLPEGLSLGCEDGNALTLG